MPRAASCKKCRLRTSRSSAKARNLADGQTFTLFMLDPETPEMRGPVRKLFSVSSTEIRPLVAKLNGPRPFIKIVDHDEDALRAVRATPGAVGIVDVYAIDSSVKVIRINGLLPFDPGYALKGD